MVNVWEWTSEYYHRGETYQEQESPDPQGPETGLWKTLRGGSFMNLPSYCSCTHREPAEPTRIAYIPLVFVVPIPDIPK